MTDMLPAFPESLVAPTPEAGFQLAIKLSRLGVKATQPDTEIPKKLRPKHARDADALIESSQVAAIHYQTIAAANDFWRKF